MKYRKKPVIIEAVQFEDTTKGLMELDALGLSVIVNYADNAHPTIKIKTLEGTMLGNVGDFIIKGVKGEFYPCKPDIFEATYEKVEE